MVSQSKSGMVSKAINYGEKQKQKQNVQTDAAGKAGPHRAYSERADTIVNWTQLNWLRASNTSSSQAERMCTAVVISPAGKRYRSSEALH